jgi:hypothetical protein
MHTPRKRTLVTNAGLLTAVTLSLCLLAGCNGARFMMGGDPSQPVNPTGTSPSTPGTSSAQTVKLSGQASLNGQAVANATVKVYNAITNQPVNIVAAGGGNIVAAGGGNYKVLQTAGTTKADGSFNIEAPVATAIRIVITTSDGRKLTSVAAGNGQGLGHSNINSGSIKVNEYTTVTDQFSRGPLKMMGALKAEVVASLVNNFLVGLNNVLNELEAKKLTPAEVDALLTNTDETGRVTNTAALDKLVDDKQIGGQVNSTVKSATQSVAEKAADRTNVIKDIQVDAFDFAGTEFSITVKDGQIVITNTATGESTSVDLTPEAPTGEQPGEQQPTEQDGIVEDTEVVTNPDGTVVTSASFNPTVQANATSGLTIKVNQPVGSEDIASVYARLPLAGVSLNAAAIASSTVGVTGSSAGSFSFTLVEDAAAASTVTLPARFGGGSLTGATWKGWLKKGTTTVASFQVFTTGSYYYLVTSYQLSDAVRSNGGHTTTLSTTALSGIDAANTKVEVTMTSRNGNLVDRTNALNETLTL